jgi:hypothetical protein
MTFEVPASKASIEQDVFKFSIPGHKTMFSVKRLKFLSVGQRESIGDDTATILDLFGAKGTKQGDAVRSLDEEQFDALSKAWQDDSKITLGESEASSS